MLQKTAQNAISAIKAVAGGRSPDFVTAERLKSSENLNSGETSTSAVNGIETVLELAFLFDTNGKREAAADIKHNGIVTEFTKFNAEITKSTCRFPTGASA